MLTLDRRTLIRSAAVGSAVAAFASSAEAAVNGNYYVIAELVSKPDQADALRAILVPFVAGAHGISASLDTLRDGAYLGPGVLAGVSYPKADIGIAVPSGRILHRYKQIRR
jgi:hypothetical protein